MRGHSGHLSYNNLSSVIFKSYWGVSSGMNKDCAVDHPFVLQEQGSHWEEQMNNDPRCWFRLYRVGTAEASSACSAVPLSWHQKQTPGYDGHESDLLWSDLRNPSKSGEVELGREGEPSEGAMSSPVQCWGLWQDLAGTSEDNVITSRSCPHQGCGSWGAYMPPVVSHWPRTALKGSFWFFQFVGKAGSGRLGVASDGWTKGPQVLTVGNESG